MLEFFLFVLLSGNPLSEFFPGYSALPNPTPDDQVIIPIPPGEQYDERDPIKTA